MSSISRLEILYQTTLINKFVLQARIFNKLLKAVVLFFNSNSSLTMTTQETNIRCKIFFKHSPYLFQYFILNCKKGSLKMRTALTTLTDRLLSVQKHGFTYFVMAAKMTLNIDLLHWFQLKIKKKYSIIESIYNFLNVHLVREKRVIKRAKIFR